MRAQTEVCIDSNLLRKSQSFVIVRAAHAQRKACFDVETPPLGLKLLRTSLIYS